jgi:hypothetical protein
LPTIRPRSSNTLLSIVRENPARVSLLVVAAVMGNLALGSVAPAESFDKHLRETVVDLGPSLYLMPRDKSHIRPYCSYYPDFMVKQLNDPGQKGTRWVTIAPTANGQIPACRWSHGPTERFIAKEWWSFVGAKGPLLFLEAADGSSGGMPFRILDLKTGKKIFEDSAWWDGHLEFAHTADGKISLRYLRVVEGDCSIPKSGANCWNKFREKYGPPLATAPKCNVVREKWVRDAVFSLQSQRYLGCVRYSAVCDRPSAWIP